MPTIETIERSAGTRYRVRVRHPDPAPGKSGYTSATFATRPEAQRFIRDCDDRGILWALTEYLREKGDGGPTLDEWAPRHFAALTGADGATIRRYRSVYKNTWSPLLGHLPLTTITRTDVATALNTVTGKDKTRKNKWSVLTHIFKTAMHEGLISRSPCAGVQLGRRTDHEREEHRYLTHDEFAAVYAATPDYWKPFVLTFAGTGIRYGEAAALTVGDVDLKAGMLSVTKAEKDHPDKPGVKIIGPTKSRRSRRTVTLPRQLVEALRPLVEGRPRDARLFLPPNGGPLRHKTFYYDIWLAKCVIPVTGTKPRIHDLRHTHAAWLIASNTPLPVIQARLGHEDIRTTINTYGHLLPDLQIAAAHAAEVALAGVRLAIES